MPLIEDIWDHFEKDKVNRLQLGTIVTSVLNFEKFSELNKDPNPGSFDPTVSKWAPMDGRAISGSLLALWTLEARVPDARGMFLRGLNTLDAVTGPRTTDADPDNNRIVGSYQADAFQGHRHFSDDQLVKKGDKDLPNQPDQRPNQKYSANSAGIHDAGYGKPRVSTETRPKNIAVYYYIKIN